MAVVISRGPKHTPRTACPMLEFAKYLARPAIPQNTGGLMTPRHFPAITQTEQSKAGTYGYTAASNLTFVGPGPCRRIGRRLFISAPSVVYRKVCHDARHEVLEVERFERRALVCSVR